MTVLGSQQIREYLEKGFIFRSGTWDPNCIREAGYDLRVATDFLVVGGNAYPEGVHYYQDYIKIESGEVAILSTVERLNMPNDLVGHLGIRFRWTRLGLSALFGAQVDPGYGADYDEERLYLFVCNLSNQPVQFRPGQGIFNIEFARVEGEIERRPREFLRPFIEQRFFTQPERHLGFVRDINQSLAALKENMEGAQKDLKSTTEERLRIVETEVRGVVGGLTQVVLFGVFLVAATLFGGAGAVLITILLNPALPSALRSLGNIAPMAICGILLLSILVATGLLVIFGRAVWTLSRRSDRQSPTGSVRNSSSN